MSLSTIFQLFRGCQFYWWRKPEYLEKTIDPSQVTDKFFVLGLSVLVPFTVSCYLFCIFKLFSYNQ
jgi:hypothetical protein